MFHIITRLKIFNLRKYPLSFWNIKAVKGHLHLHFVNPAKKIDADWDVSLVDASNTAQAPTTIDTCTILILLFTNC